MRRGDLKYVDSTAALHELKARYIKVGPGGCNNVYLLDRFLDEGSGFRGALLEELDGGIACFLDRNTHYQLILSVPFGNGYRLPRMGQEVCCEFIAYSDKPLEQTEHFRTFLLENGFDLLDVFQEFRYCAGQLHPKAKAELQDAAAYVEQLGMRLEPVRPGSKRETERLISGEIGKYDAVSYGETEWLEQISCGNIMAVYHGDELAALDLFQPNGSRYVTNPAYRGMKLGYIAVTALLSEARWKHSKQWQREWIAASNLASEKTARRLGYTPTNRLKYRFIQYPGVESSK